MISDLADCSPFQHYNHVANQNKAANEAAYKKWVSSHPVEEILKANTARLGLKRLLRRPQSFTPLKDDRIVKRPKSGYVAYFQERIASGDLKHMKVGDMGRLVGQEWRGLNSNEKKVSDGDECSNTGHILTSIPQLQKYDDLAALDLARYKQEVKTVYNRDVPPPRSPAAAAAA